MGRQLLDPTQVEQARVDAFLHVPLYKAVYEKFDGTVLPNTNRGLEDALQGLGVSPKQTDRARQGLQRSAERAGFFRSGANYLVKPALSESPETEVDRTDRGGKLNAVQGLPPMMIEMWLTLLRGEGKKWPPDKVAAFVKNAQQIDKLLTSQ